MLLGDELNRQVQAYLLRLCEAGCVVNSSIVLSAASGIVMKHASNLLDTNGGPISIKSLYPFLMTTPVEKPALNYYIGTIQPV